MEKQMKNNTPGNLPLSCQRLILMSGFCLYDHSGFASFPAGL